MTAYPTVDELTETEDEWYEVEPDMAFGDSSYVRTTGGDRVEVHTASGDVKEKFAREVREGWTNQGVTEFIVTKLDEAPEGI